MGELCKKRLNRSRCRFMEGSWLVCILDAMGSKSP